MDFQTSTSTSSSLLPNGSINTTPILPTDQYRQLYPPIQPFNKGYLKVSDIHSLYYEESGQHQEDAKHTVCVLHGGPGGGCADFYRQFFNPEKYHIVMHDQRGAGRSSPHASLIDNTTQHLVADIERLREHLKIDRWHVFGGSWGSTLALAYAETHPERVTALILRGIFMLRRRELEWFYQQGASFLYPDEWERYLAPIPIVERWDLMSAYNRILTDDSNPTQMLIAAKAWSRWELATSRLFTEQEAIKKAEEDDKFVIAFARIENHYFVHGGFLQHDNQLLRDADKIAHIPTVIVHGRYDLVCPFENAWDLKKRLPQADLFIVPNAGHSLKEDGIRHELIEAADRFADL